MILKHLFRIFRHTIKIYYMASKAFYFQHDWYSRNDPKLTTLQRILGSGGKGIYWDLVEMLHEQGGKLKYDLDALSFELREEKSFIERVISEFGLFKVKDDFFWSDRARKNLKKQDEVSKTASNKAFKRWNKDATAMPQHNTSIAGQIPQQFTGNAIKEKKRKEIKEKEKKVNKQFT